MAAPLLKPLSVQPGRKAQRDPAAKGLLLPVPCGSGAPISSENICRMELNQLTGCA